jgi:hypothetical protein
MTTRRDALRLAAALAPAFALAACAKTGEQDGSGSYRHSSGLRVVTADSLDTHPTEEAVTVSGACFILTDLFSDEFGFAYAIGSEVTLGIATDRGQQIYEQWRSDAGLPPNARPDPEGKFIPMLNEQARRVAGKQVSTPRVARSRAMVEELHNSIDFTDPAFADAKIGATHIDYPTSVVIIHMETLTDPAAARLVQLYGTEQVAVLLEPYRPAQPL